MFRAEVHMKCYELLNHGIGTVSKIPDGIEGILEIRARRMQGDADGALPPLQQRQQVVHEGVVRMRSVRDALMALEFPLRLYIIVQHPIVAPLLRVERNRPGKRQNNNIWIYRRQL